MNQWQTRREKLVDLLSNVNRPIDINQISEILEVLDKKIIINDLEHIDKSIGYSNKKLIVINPQCKNCGFIFKKKFKIPSKCPRCKKSRISLPQFQIV
ncbi:MAG: transcriptional regulator [Candidatus Helarchaeota archaeon]